MVAKNAKFRNVFRQRALRFAMSALGLGCIGIVVVFLAYQNIQTFQRIWNLEQTYSQLEERQQEFIEQNETLRAGVVDTQTFEYQERMLREKGLYRRPGEAVITVVRPERSEEEEGADDRAWWNPFSW